MTSRIVSIAIENFRALRNLQAVFHPMTVIIGENDVGKSSCMLALHTLFKRKSLDSKSDFFKMQASNPVVIEAAFQITEPNEHQAKYLIDSQRLVARCTYMLSAPRTAEILLIVPEDSRLRDIWSAKVADLRLLLAEYQICDNFEKMEKEQCQKRLGEFVKNNLPPEKLTKQWVGMKEAEFLKILPEFILVPVNRELAINMKSTESSLFSLLFKSLFNDALKTDETANSIEQIQKSLVEGAKSRIDDLERLLRNQLNDESVRLSHTIDLDIVKGLDFEFEMSDDRAPNIPMCNRGAGVHNNLILAMFRLLAQHGAKDFILAIEEPENSLHPRGQREMLWALQSVSRSAQVICTTHSSVFLDLGRLEDNIVLTRTNDGSTIPRSFKSDNPELLRDLLGIRISDALLGGGGNAAIIVEGPTEQGAFPHFFRLGGSDYRSLGISIVKAGGSDFQKIRQILLVLDLYSIPSVVILDNDARPTVEDLERIVTNGTIKCLKRAVCLKKGTFEDYIPIELALSIINERFQGDPIIVSDLCAGKPREDEFERLIHLKKRGSRFEHFKVEFGELAGRRMVDDNLQLDDELREVLDFVCSLVTERSHAEPV